MVPLFLCLIRVSGHCASQTENTPGNATPQYLDPARYSLHLISTVTRTWVLAYFNKSRTSLKDTKCISCKIKCLKILYKNNLKSFQVIILLTTYHQFSKSLSKQTYQRIWWYISPTIFLGYLVNIYITVNSTLPMQINVVCYIYSPNSNF